MKHSVAGSQRLAWAASLIGFILLVAGSFLAKGANATAMVPACLASAALLLMSLVAAGRARVARRHEQEEEAFTEHRREHGSDELFEDADEALRLAARTNRQYVKVFVPAFTAALGAAMIVSALMIWARWSDAPAFAVASKPLPYAVLALSLFLVGVIAGSYFLGSSREAGHRWLRPSGAWLFLNAALYLASSIVLLCDNLRVGVERLDVTIGRIGLVILLALGAEMFIGFVIEFYRPRNLDEEERPLFESRLLALFTEPGGIAQNVAAALDYQFGFQVSEVWFYRFLERTVIPFAIVMATALWLLTCLVLVDAEERGIRERFGAVVSKTPLKPGIYVKLPTPLARIRKFPTARIQQVAIGYSTDEETRAGAPPPPQELLGDPSGRVIVWTKTHNATEFNFIVASGPDQEPNEQERPESAESLPVSVYFITASVPLYFKIEDPYKYLYLHRNPEQILEEIATREVARFLASVEFFSMLTHRGAESGTIISERVQAAADAIDLGIEVVFLGMQGLHPPVFAGRAFDEVVAAMEEKHDTILKAEQYAVGRKPAAEADALTLKSQARAHLQTTTLVAKAEAERFEHQLSAYRASPELFPLRSFLSMLENEGAAARKYVVVTDNAQEVVIINLETKARPDLLDLDYTEPETTD